MDQSKKNELGKLLKELLEAQSCCKELKEIATKVSKTYDDKDIELLKEELKADVSSIDMCIGFLESDMGKQIYGTSRDAVLKDAKDKKAKGEKTCICGACQAGAKILKLLA